MNAEFDLRQNQRFSLYSSLAKLDMSQADFLAVKCKIIPDGMNPFDARVRVGLTDWTGKTIERDISTAIENIAQLRENIRISEIILDAAELDHRLVTEQYQLGSASILDVLRIATDLKDAKTKLVQAKYTLKIAEAALEHIIGRVTY